MYKKKSMQGIIYTCDICGNKFESGRPRYIARNCKRCAEKLRREGKGPIQIQRHIGNA